MPTTADIRISDTRLNITLLVDEPIYTLRQSADGTPHVSYFAENRSFCWSGDPTEPIEVSYGGAGEPVTAMIEFPTEPGRATVQQQLDLFKAVCDRYLVQVMEVDL